MAIPKVPAPASIRFTRPIQHGLDPLHTAPPTPSRQPKAKPPFVDGCTYNIRDGRGSGGEAGLLSAIRMIGLAGLHFAILTETKISTDIYTKNSLGYDVVCTRSEPRSGGVALITKDQPDGWHFESTETYGPNVISTVLVSGTRRTHIVGAYLPPSSLQHLPDLESALS